MRGCRIAARAGYNVGDVKEARPAFRRDGSRLCVASLRAALRPGHGIWLQRELSCPGYCAAPSARSRASATRDGGEAFRGVDDGVGVDAVVAIEVIDGPGLAEMFDTERFDAVAVHAAEPAERGRMAVDHGHDAAVARKRRKQFLDMAEMRYPAAVAPQLARRGPSGKQPVGRGDRQQTDVAATLTQ